MFLYPIRQPCMKRRKQEIIKQSHWDEIISCRGSFTAILFGSSEDPGNLTPRFGVDPDANELLNYDNVVSKVTDFFITVKCLTKAYIDVFIMTLKAEVIPMILGEVFEVTVIKQQVYLIMEDHAI